MPPRSRTSLPASPFRLVMLTLLWCLTACPAWAAQSQPWTGKVTAVENGSTLEVSQGGRTETLLLAGVAAPELSQPWGRQAREFVQQSALGQEVTVEPQGTDHKKRPLATIILPDGRDLGAEMVKDGLAWHYQRFSKNPLLGDMQKDARADQRGLWSEPGPVPPWEWRSRHGEEAPAEGKRKKKRSNQ